jgi:hypothetical protein
MWSRLSDEAQCAARRLRLKSKNVVEAGEGRVAQDTVGDGALNSQQGEARPEVIFLGAHASINQGESGV